VGSSSGALKERDTKLVLDQGEIFSGVPFIRWKDGKAKEDKGRVIVSSHGCVCENYERALELGRSDTAKKAMVQVIPLQPATDFRQKFEMIRRGETYDLFFVEGDGNEFQHHVAVLTKEQPIPAEILVESCTRLVQVSDWQWEALRLHQTLARFRTDPEKIFRDELLKAAEKR
jgi:hypothetical protein